MVVIDHCAQPSGGQIALERLISELGDRAAIHVIAGEPGPMIERWRHAGATVEVLPLPQSLTTFRRSDGVVAGLGLLPPMASSSVRLARRIRELGPDLVHCNSMKACVYGAAASILARTPLLWHVRDRLDAQYLPPVLSKAMRHATRVPQVVIANSWSTLQALPSSLRRGFVSYSPVPPQPVASSPGWPVVGLAGRISDWKGHEVVLRALASRPGLADVRLRIAGAPLFGEDALFAHLRQLTLDLGMGSRVDWLGHVENLGVERQGWGIAVHASTLSEPFGMVIVEAMACGLPVIATAGGGPSEIITDGVDGLLVSPGDVESLADALERVLGDRELAVSMGAAAQLRSRDFSPAVAAQTVLAAWSEIELR